MGRFHPTFPTSLFCQLSKIYGPVFTISMAHKKAVVLAGYKAVKQALVNQADDFGDREVLPIFHDFNKGNGTRTVEKTFWSHLFWFLFDESLAFRNTLHQRRAVERNEAFYSEDIKRFWDGKKYHGGEDHRGVSVPDRRV